MNQPCLNTLPLSVVRTSSYVIDGATIFTVKGVTSREGPDKFFTVNIPASAVSSRQILSELSLLQSGNLLVIDFEGTVANDGFVDVDSLLTLQVRR